MQPSYLQIAELFGLKAPDVDPEVQENRRKKVGKTAQESEELGRMSLSDGDYEAAIKHFRKAVEQRDPGDIHARIELGGAFEYADQAPQAMRQYERAIQIRQDAPEPHVGLSEIYRRYGRYKESIEELHTAIELEPGNAFFHHKLASVWRELGEKQRALVAAQGAVAAAPDESFYHYWIGDLLIEMRRYSEALDSLRAAIELSPGDDFLYLRAAVAFWGTAQRQEAVKAVRLASDLDPAKNLYYGVLGLLLTEMGLEDEALLEHARAQAMDAYDHEALRRLAIEAGIGSTVQTSLPTHGAY
jgi:tetratricopeptide (TPR) repeat protein